MLKTTPERLDVGRDEAVGEVGAAGLSLHAAAVILSASAIVTRAFLTMACKPKSPPEPCRAIFGYEAPPVWGMCVHALVDAPSTTIGRKVRTADLVW